MTRILLGGASLRPEWTGGEPLIVRQLTEGFRRRGHEVTFAVRASGFRGTVGLGTSPTDWDPLSLAHYERALRKERPEVVLGFYDYDSSLQIASQRLEIPYVACVHFYWPFCPIGVLYIDGQGICSGAGFTKCLDHMDHSVPDAHLPLHLRRFSPALGALAYSKFRGRLPTLARADSIIVPSPRYRALLEAAGCTRVRSVPCGVEASEFPGQPWTGAQPKVVFFPSAISSERKGAGEFRAAAALLRKDHPDTRFVATNSVTTDLIEGTPRLSRPEMVDHYDRSYLVVVPSIWDEVHSIVVLEAMAARRPVVAFAVGGIPELVVDQQTGLLVNRGDTRAFADAIGRLLDDPVLAEQYGRAGRTRLETHFTLSKMVDGYLAAVEDLLRA